VSHVYMHAWTLCCSHSLIRTQTFQRALTVSGQLHEDEECLFIGVTNSGRVWRKVPESDTRSVPSKVLLTPCNKQVAYLRKATAAATMAQPQNPYTLSFIFLLFLLQYFFIFFLSYCFHLTISSKVRCTSKPLSKSH